MPDEQGSIATEYDRNGFPPGCGCFRFHEGVPCTNPDEIEWLASGGEEASAARLHERMESA